MALFLLCCLAWAGCVGALSRQAGRSVEGEALGAQAAAARQVFHATEATDIFSSASISLHPPSPPTFAIAADNGSPYLAVYSAAGAEAWRWSSPCAGCSLASSTARHVELDPVAPGKVDTFAIQSGNGACTVMGFDGEGSGAPAWSADLEGCSELARGGVGGTYTGLAASDDGRALAVLGYGQDTPGGNLTARAYLISGQTGKLAWKYDLGVREHAGQGDISIGRDYVAFINEDGSPSPNAAQLHVLGVATGALRAEVQIPFFIAGAITDDGEYVVVQNFTHLKGSEPWVLRWDASASAYLLLHRLALPADGTEYDLWDISIPGGPSSYVALGWISAIPSALLLRVTAYDLASGALLTDWSAPPNAQLQNNPTIRCDGKYIGLGLWGDSGEAPTAVILAAGSNAALFNATSPGSMFSVDLALDRGTLYIATAGKHVVRRESARGGRAPRVTNSPPPPSFHTRTPLPPAHTQPANEMGAGGDAYGWSVTV